MTEVSTETNDARPSDETPPPTFDALPLSAEVRKALAEMGYENPTPVQLAVWEPATRNADAVVQARTGTGKTASFGLPVVDHCVRRSVAAPQALILCPTRELALQVAGELERLAKYKGVGIVAVYGGAPIQRQIDAIAGGAQVVVGTPGRVLDHIKRGTLPTKALRLLILDESDEMLSMGFERELNAILDRLPDDRQTLLFSATVPPDIERIAQNRLRNPEFVTLSGDHIGALEIEHYVYMVASDKRAALLRVLEVENPESAIIFCNTRDETELVAGALQRAGYAASWLNGDLPQNEREQVMAATRSSELRFLVATDVAARGIDISHLTHVINNDFPQDAETYVHRTGRTGRAGRTGTAISLVTPQDIGNLYLLRLTYKIRPMERQVPTAGELATRAQTDLVSFLASAFREGQHQDDISLARRILTHDEAEQIVSGLLREHLGERPKEKEAATAARKAPRFKMQMRAQGRLRGTRRGGDAEPVENDRGGRRRRNRDNEPEEKDIRATEASPEEAPASEPPRVDTAPIDSLEPTEASASVAEEDHDGPPQRKRRRRKRRGTTAASEPPPIDRERDDDGRSDGDRPPAKALADWEPPEEDGDDSPILDRSRRSDPPEDEDGEDAELYINVGRRDGVRTGDILDLLTDTAGVDRELVGRIRVRDRHTFVILPRLELERAVAELDAVEYRDRTLVVEEARGRRDD